MRFGLQLVSYAIGLPLQILVVATLIRGSWRRFPLLLALSAVELITSLVLLPGSLESSLGLHSRGLPYWVTYWPSQVINQLLLYAVVISLLYRACERFRSAAAARVALILGACLLVGGTFLACYDPSLTRGLWMTPWFRDLSFVCALMDIVLWTSLLVTRDKDRQLMLLSGGLGVEFAGHSIGESLRQMAIHSRSVPLVTTGNVVLVAASVFRFYVWWRALRVRQPERKTSVEFHPVPEPDGLL